MLFPVTKSGALIDETNRVLLVAKGYVSPDQIWYRRLLKEGKALLKVDAVEGHNVLAQLYGLVGDVESARSHIEAALNLHQSPLLQSNKASILSNLGYFREAQPAFVSGSLPEHGLFTARWRLGICVGAFHALVRGVDMSERMGLDLRNVDAALIRRAVRLMDEIELSDEQLAIALDAVGEVMRSERLFFMGEGPEVSVWDEDALEKHLAIVYRLPVSNAKAMTLDETLGDKLAEREALPHQVMLHIESGLASDERLADRPTLAG